MATHRLVIDGDDNGSFALALRDGTLTLGADPARADLVLDSLRVVRIHCEVEVADGPPVVGNDLTTTGAPPRGQALHPGHALQFPHAQVRLESDGADAAPAANIPDTPVAAGVARRLLVVDGADRGWSYPVPESGTTTIGNNHKHAAIVMHDLYVARLHCEVHVTDGRTMVTHKHGAGGTLINGKRITEHELKLGDILRVGNSHLRFEVGVAEPPAAPTVEDDSVTFSVAPPGRPGDSTATPRPSSADQATMIAGPADPLLQLEGQVLGHYQFGALLGRGLAGLVFRAHHRESNQAVTLKVLAPAFPANDAELQNFIRVIKLVAPLRHPHLATIYGAGKTGPYCWIAREFIEGDSLAAMIGRQQSDGKPGWKRACRLAVQLGKTLDFLHEHRIVPGRLTPANVLIVRDSKATKLTDVMLDEALHGSRLATLIHDRRQLAELPYAAPEQIEPGAAADTRAALYGLGALLYALLTGQPPYIGSTPADISAQIRAGKLTRPTKLVRDIPPPIEAAVLKLLARRPEERFQSAAELLAVVEPIANIHEIKV